MLLSSFIVCVTAFSFLFKQYLEWLYNVIDLHKNQAMACLHDVSYIKLACLCIVLCLDYLHPFSFRNATLFFVGYNVRVLDNLKDYAVRALVNAVDHLGTVAYKLTDLLEQQTVEVSTMELKVSCLNQVISLHFSGLYASTRTILNGWAWTYLVC